MLGSLISRRRGAWVGCVSGAIAAITALLPSAVEAHGRFPAAGSVAIDPGAPERVMVRTTYGILQTEDAGGLWSWVCPEAIGFDADREDPPLVVATGGSVVVGTFNGLVVSHDGCDYGAVGGELEGRYFVDVQPEADPSELIALSSNGLAGGTFEVNLWSSADSGSSWTHLGMAPPADFLALSLATAPSDPARLYLSGRDGSSGAYEAVVQMSADRGASWTRIALPEGMSSTGKITAYLGGVQPGDPDRIYVGVAETNEDNEIIRFVVLFSENAGQDWQNIYERAYAVTGFALSPDGDTVAVGSEQDGLFTAPVSTHAFEKISELHIRCLAWNASGIYACVDEFKDGYTLGLSKDEGATFDELMNLSSPCGPPACALASSVGKECPARWPSEQAELGAEDCGAGPSSSSAAATTGGSGEGCACAVPAPEDRPLGEAALASLLLGLGAVAFRRRRR
jgi:MYXO-CTERM domain-containing protein